MGGGGEPGEGGGVALNLTQFVQVQEFRGPAFDADFQVAVDIGTRSNDRFQSGLDLQCSSLWVKCSELSTKSRELDGFLAFHVSVPFGSPRE